MGTREDFVPSGSRPELSRHHGKAPQVFRGEHTEDNEAEIRRSARRRAGAGRSVESLDAGSRSGDGGGVWKGIRVHSRRRLDTRGSRLQTYPWRRLHTHGIWIEHGRVAFTQRALRSRPVPDGHRSNDPVLTSFCEPQGLTSGQENNEGPAPIFSGAGP